MKYLFQPIGSIRTPYKTIKACPRNIVAGGPTCQIILNPEYSEGLFGLKVGDRILLLYWMNQASFSDLILPSRKTGEMKGIFALRTPQRPNPIGVATVTIADITDNEIIVHGLDCLDGTPLLDIKPAMQGR